MNPRFFRAIFVILIVLGLGGGAWGNTFTWLGVNTDWSDFTNNWLDGGSPATSLPGSLDDVVIPSTANDPSTNSLAYGTIQSLTLTSSTLTLVGDLTVTASVSNGGAIDVGTNTLTVPNLDGNGRCDVGNDQ